VAVFGIDLGTTYSSISYLDATGRATVVPSRESGDSTPSAVYFESADSVVVGIKAKDTAVLEPDLVIDLIKRELGRHLTLRMHGTVFTPEQVSALILRRLVRDVAEATDTEVTDAVITVPAYFGITERAATRRGGEIAGLRVIDVLSEPVAAAISYGAFDVDADRTILVYDLGGGTFDTTVVRVSGGNIDEVSTGGDTELGGVDWDERLAEFVVEAFITEHPDAEHPFDDPATVQDIRAQVEAAKLRLTEVDSHTVRVVHAGQVTSVTITRDRFEELTADLLDRTVVIVRNALRAAADRGEGTIDQVLLVGGSSKMPAVARRLAAELGQEPRLHDPDLAVAKGAAWYAFEETYRRLVREGRAEDAATMARQAGLSTEQEERIAGRRISRVASRAFGVLALDEEEHVVHLIARNDRLPAEAVRTFHTATEAQAQINLYIMEQAGPDGSISPADHREIATGTVKVPPGQPAGWPVDVTFLLTASGMLQVAAIDQNTGQRIDLETRIDGHSDEEVAAARDVIAAIRIS
jgi:molecular chaperone DnaK